MTCENYQEMLSAYLDQALTEGETEHLEEHLKECGHCRRELAGLRETVTMLRSMAEVEPPVEFRQQLRQRLQAEKNDMGSQRPSFVSRVVRSPWLPLSAVAALLLVFIGVVGIMNLWLQPLGSKADIADESQYDRASKMQIAEEKANYSKARVTEGGEVRSQDMKIADRLEAAGIQKEKALPPETEQAQIERKVIRRASFMVEVKDVPAAEKQLRQMVEKFGGYIQSANIRKEKEDHYYASLTLRVPRDKFNAVVDEIHTLGEIKDSSMGGQDVTREYYDTQARLKVMKGEEESLLKILDKAEKIEDIMQVRRELSRVRQEIEVQEGQLKYLTHMTDLATIDVSLRQEEVPKTQISTTGMGGVWSRTVQAFILSTNRLIKGLGEALVGFGALLPILLLLAAVILVIVALVRFKSKNSAE